MRAARLARWAVGLGGLALAAPALRAQSTGTIAGHVREQPSQAPVHGAQVLVDGRLAVLTDSAGAYVVRGVQSGLHRVTVRLIGFATATRDSVPVRSAEETRLDFPLAPQAVQLGAVSVEVPPDAVLDPLATATVQHISAEDLRRLPVSTLEEAVALSAGAVGESYRGGRLGEQSFIIDGLGIKNQLDASTGTLGINVPPDILTEASLVTNGFSARYGQALSGLVNVVTKDGGDRWSGRAAYETDRGLGSSLDHGLDRGVFEADGPLPFGARLVGVVDATGRLDADPVNAPAPSDPVLVAHDPRARQPYMLPHGAGQEVDAAAKLTVPFAGRQALRLFALRSAGQQLLYDQAYKYDQPLAPAQRLTGELLTGQLQLVSPPSMPTPILADLRAGYFTREFERGTLDVPVSYPFGAFADRGFHFVGESLARARDTAAANAAVPGFATPDYSAATPWGVPAFFLGGGSDGEIAWNRFTELRSQLDVDVGLSPRADVYLGGELVRQRVETFERTLAFLPVGDTVPPATASDFSPTSAAAYAETQLRAQDLALTFGLRYDTFDPHAAAGKIGAHASLNPRFALSAVLHGATVVASFGRFSQAPDFQYLVDAAFEDTTRTGRFRVGNPNLGFEQSTQYEFSVRARPTAQTSLRANVYVKRLQGLVASVPFGLDLDSTIFANADYGSVKGIEILFERELKDWWGVRVAYTLQWATATASNAFQRPVVDTVAGDTIFPGQSEFPLDYDQRHGLTVVAQGRSPDAFGPRLLGARVLGGWEGAVIFRFASGLPYTKTSATGDTLLGPINAERLPSQSTLDALLRRPLSLLGVRGSLYLDVRNVLDARNLVAVRRDTGTPGLGEAGIQAAALAAYQAHPEAIPYESPRYRGWADLNHDGYLAGRAELLPLYVAAARDFYQPLFYYGPPRLVRVGVEFTF